MSLTPNRVNREGNPDMLDQKHLTHRDPQVAGVLAAAQIALWREESIDLIVPILQAIVPDLTVEQANIAIDQIGDLLATAERLFEENPRRDQAEIDLDEWVGHAADVAVNTIATAGQPLTRGCGDPVRHAPHGWLDDTDRGLVERVCPGIVHTLAHAS